MRIRLHCRTFFLAITALVASHTAPAADLSGEWVGQITGPFDSQYTAQYNHVALKANDGKISGFWGVYVVTGNLTGDMLSLSLADARGTAAGMLTGRAAGEEFDGKGSVIPARRANTATSTATAQPPQDVTWKLTRPAAPPASPQSYNYEPKSYYGIYSAAEPPALHIFPVNKYHYCFLLDNGIQHVI